MQVVHYKKDVFRSFASFEEQALLKNGQSVVRPYRSSLVVQNYTRGSNVTIRDFTNTNETLTVDQQKVIGFQVDDFDELQSNYNLQDEYAKDAAKALGNSIDGKVLQQVLNATSVVDNAMFGGSAGDPISATTANVMTILHKSNQKLDEQNIDIDLRFTATSPQMLELLNENAAGRETIGGDKIDMNGYQMTRAGFDIHLSNNLVWTGVLAFPTIPVAADTVTVNGVVFTYRAALTPLAGEVLIGISADTAAANLAALINAPGTTTAQGVALSQANQDLLVDISASYSSPSLTITAIGKSFISVAETLTPAGDVWSKLTQHNLSGRKGCIDVVIQKEPSVKVNPIPQQLGVFVLPSTLFGVKAFREGAQAMVDCKINTATF